MRTARSVFVLAATATLLACGSFLGIGSEIPDGEEPGSDASSDAPLESTTSESCTGDACEAATATCPDDGCPPELLASGVGDAARRIVASDGWLYVIRTTGGNPRPVRLKAELGAAVEELDPTGGVTNAATGSLVVHPSGLYWATTNGLRYRNTSGGTDAEDLDPGLQVRAMAIAGNTLRYSRFSYDTAGGRLITCTLPGCADKSQELANNMGDLLVLPTGRLWFGFPKGGQTFSLFDSQGEIEADVMSPSWMVTDGQLAYYSTVNGLRVVSPAARKADNLLPTTIVDRVEGVVADGAGVLYFARGAAIHRCLVPACSASLTVATTPPNPDAGTQPERATDVAVDAKYVYWVTNKANVFRVKKP